MIFDILVLLLILLITGYYASQGLFSATLSLVAAIFASVLAMGLFEPLQGIVGGYRPAYARGITFMLVFFLALSACRLAADFAVRKNVKFTKAIDSAAGGVVGFFAALVIVGSCVIGWGMLPLPTNVLAIGSLGFNRYPEASGMMGAQAGSSTPNVAAPRHVWLMPDSFTLAIWNGASGRGLGGATAFDAVHPDLTVESYGYRNMVSYSSNSALPDNLLSIPGVYVTDSPKNWGMTQAELDKMSPADAAKAKEGEAGALASLDGKELVVVRIEVNKGTAQPNVSADTDGFFRITPSQVRLVTDKGNQYYPVGQLVNGVTFEAMPLDTSHLVDDYVGDKVIEEWVFAINHDEKPAVMEVKQLARVDLADKIKDKPLPVLAASAYPKRDYLLNKTTLTVALNIKARGAQVYVLPQTTPIESVLGLAQTQYKKITTAITDIEGATEPWRGTAGKPGVPNEGELRGWQRRARDNVLDVAHGGSVAWSEAIPPIMIGEATPSGSTNVTALPEFFKTIQALQDEKRASGVTGVDGTVALPGIAPGKYTVIASLGTSDGYYLWIQNVDLKAKTPQTVPLALNNADLSFVLTKK